MAGVNFVLGPNESYFFNCPRLWARHNLPPEIEMLFTKQPPIQDVFEMALGENRAYFVSYRDADGGVYCRLNNLPPLLTTFLSGPTPPLPSNRPPNHLMRSPLPSPSPRVIQLFLCCRQIRLPMVFTTTSTRKSASVSLDRNRDLEAG